MIKEVIMYTVICDLCGKDGFKNSEYCAWSDKSSAIDMIGEDWVRIDDKHYCHDCWEWDEEGDNQIPKQKTNT